MKTISTIMQVLCIILAVASLVTAIAFDLTHLWVLAVCFIILSFIFAPARK